MATLPLDTRNHYTITTAAGDTLVIERELYPGRKGIAGGKIVLESGEWRNTSLVETVPDPTQISKYIINGVIYEDHSTAPVIVAGGILAAGETLEQVAGAVTVTPPAGTVSYTGYAPTVTADNDIIITIPVGSISYTGLAPTVTAGDNQTAAPPAGSIAYTGLAPVVTAGDNQTATPPAGAVTYSGLAPTVTAGDNQSTEIPAGSIAYTGYAPDVIYLPNPIILSVVPSAFDDGKTGVVITTENFVTAGATVKIGGVEQSVTDTTANTITITTERGTTSLGSARLEVIAA